MANTTSVSGNSVSRTTYSGDTGGKKTSSVKTINANFIPQTYREKVGFNQADLVKATIGGTVRFREWMRLRKRVWRRSIRN